MITVANGRVDGWLGEYIGRRMRNRPGSVLGNPYKIEAKTEAAHLIAVELYGQHLWGIVHRGWKRASPANRAILLELQRLLDLAIKGDLTLDCWCKPLPCHGDVVKCVLTYAIDKNHRFVPSHKEVDFE